MGDLSMKMELDFQLTQDQKRVVGDALREAGNAVYGRNEGHALEWISTVYLNGPCESRQEPSYIHDEAKRGSRIIPIDPSQLEVTHEAINAARKATGCEDDSVALVEMCQEFLYEKYGQTMAALGLARP